MQWVPLLSPCDAKNSPSPFTPKLLAGIRNTPPFCNYRCFSLCFFIEGFELKFCIVDILCGLHIYMWNISIYTHIYMYLSLPSLPPTPFYHFFARGRENVNISLLQRFVTFILLLPGALRWLVLVHIPAVNSHSQDSLWAQAMLGWYPTPHVKGDSSSFDKYVW